MKEGNASFHLVFHSQIDMPSLATFCLWPTYIGKFFLSGKEFTLYQTNLNLVQIQSLCIQENGIQNKKLIFGEVENNLEKGENAGYQHFCLFQKCSKGQRVVNPFPNKPWFLRVCKTSLLKTLWEKEKLLVMSNFSFSHSVFYPFQQLFAIFYQG